MSILITILWIIYGGFSYIRSRNFYFRNQQQEEEGNFLIDYGVLLFYIIFAPIIFIGKCLYGAFKRYR